MKRIVAFVFASVLALSLAGCASNGNQGAPDQTNTATEETKSTDTFTNNNTATKPEKSSEATEVEAAKTDTAEPKELVVPDSNYVVTKGYVKYALEIQNPNDSYGAKFATITVTGKHEDGTISFSDEWVIGNILPGSTSYWASQAGDGDTTESDTVEINVSVDDSNWYETEQTLPKNLYTFDNVSLKEAGSTRLKATGEITLNEEFSVDYTDAEEPMLVCILRDANGKIVTGFNGFMNSDLKVDKSAVFDITGNVGQPEYETAEVYANIWM